MNADIYKQLAQHLDNLPGGFPSTESGVELRILKRLFTPEEAKLAVHLTLIPEEVRVVAHRAGLDREETARRLADMARKGLIYSIHPDKGPPQYQATQFVIGIWEFQVNRLDADFIKDFEEYSEYFFNLETWKKAPQMRTIPVNKSIDVEQKIMIYEQAEALIHDKKKIVVAPCICRKERRMMGKGCAKPLETCLSFDTAADFYERNGLGRVINHQEALDILKGAEEAGLVLQPANARDITFLCCCCGDCCGILRNLKRHPRPASLVSSPFMAVVEAETCDACGTCLDRCQMEAIELDSDTVVIDAGRCIGCGLCVVTCPTDSLSLVRKPEEEQPAVPKDMAQTLVQLGRQRGKLGRAELAKMVVKSKADRLLALK
jgi:Fe-S-cluster-containing hydrogenase component 2